ncbi:MAG TPA: hypothetical protein VFD66_12910, partial [Verrucomicrobiae bacterium]|nr:hypothetical protein [Verrucomicrobiae bacterium]
PTILAENCTPPNGALDPGETLTMAFPMRNIGTLNTTNLVATLLQSNNVAFPSAPATYGALLAGGSSVTQAFSFTAGGICGGSIQPVFQLQDGTTNLGTVNMPLTLGALVVTTGNYSNATTITIPTNAPSNTVGPSSPFPSSIIVSGMTNPVSRVTVTIRGLTHGNGSDVDLLLVGPSGTNVMLMSNCSYESDVSYAFLTFDDSAPAMLSETDPIVTGTYQPSGYFSSTEIINPPAPNAPFGQQLSVFNGSNPNGTWSLYVQDNAYYNTGFINQGWALTIISSNRVCCTGMALPAPQILSIALSNSVATLVWSSVPGQTYRLQYNPNLTNILWSTIGADVIATNFTTLGTATNPGTQSFYRVVAVGH